MTNLEPHTTDQHFFYSKDVMERYQISSVSLWRWVKRGYFPEPIMVGPSGSRKCWTREMLEAFEAKHFGTNSQQ